MSLPDELLDEPTCRVRCADCQIVLDHHTGFARHWQGLRERLLCLDCYVGRIDRDRDLSE